MKEYKQFIVTIHNLDEGIIRLREENKRAGRYKMPSMEVMKPTTHYALISGWTKEAVDVAHKAGLLE